MTATDALNAMRDAIAAGAAAASDEQRDQAAADLGAAATEQFRLLDLHLGETVPDDAEWTVLDREGRIAVRLDERRGATLDHDLGLDYAVLTEVDDDGERHTAMRHGEPADLPPPSSN